MAKAKKKSAKEASNIFHNIMQASVKGNPKPEPKKPTNYNFTGTIDGVSFHFRRENESKYTFWEAKGGITLAANKAKDGNWEVQPYPPFTNLNARVSGLINRYENAKASE